MSCEPAWESYREALAALSKIHDQLLDFAERLGGQLGPNPSLLLNGDLNSWRRFAREAEAAASAQHQALERYIEAAMHHDAEA